MFLLKFGVNKVQGTMQFRRIDEVNRESTIGQVRRWCYILAESARGTSLRNVHADRERSRVRERPACLDEVLPLLGLWNATSLYVASGRGRRRRERSGGSNRRRRREAAEEEIEAKSWAAGIARMRQNKGTGEKGT